MYSEPVHDKCALHPKQWNMTKYLAKQNRNHEPGHNPETKKTEVETGYFYKPVTSKSANPFLHPSRNSVWEVLRPSNQNIRKIKCIALACRNAATSQPRPHCNCGETHPTKLEGHCDLYIIFPAMLGPVKKKSLWDWFGFFLVLDANPQGLCNR